MNKYNEAFHQTIRRFLSDKILYYLLAKGASRLLRRELAKRSIEVFSITHRPKGLPSVLEKLERKSYQDLNAITDRAGVRVICVYENNISPTLDVLNDLFLIQNVEDTAKRGGPSSFGYVSYHCLLKWNPKHPGPILFEDLPYYLRYDLHDKPIEEEQKMNIESHIKADNRATHDLLFEIQVRTILQHAWASISNQIQYKHESDVPESVQRKLARLAAILEEADEAFAEQLNLSTSMPRQKGISLRITDHPISIGYIKEYSKNVLSIDLPEKEAIQTLDYIKAIGVKNVLEFEQVMVSTLEALEAAFSSILNRHLRSLSCYLCTVAVWAGIQETPFPASQQQEIDNFRDLVHEEMFQRTLRKLQKNRKMPNNSIE